jgi:hypothetical protein
VSDNGKGGTILEALQTVLQSQVGGWVLACAAFGFLSWWTIKDREVLYQDVARLRAQGMSLIQETRDVVASAKNFGDANNQLIREGRKLEEENNANIKEILKTLQSIEWGNRQRDAAQPVPYGVLEIPTIHNDQPSNKSP